MTLDRESDVGKKRRAQIIKSATRIMSKKGYIGASIQAVADRVGIHKSTFFHYFNNKEELLQEVLKAGIGEVTGKLIPITENNDLSGEEKLKQAITNHVAVLIKHIDNVNVFQSELRYLPDKQKKEYIDKRDGYEAIFRKIIDELKRSNRHYFQGMDSKLVTLGIIGMCNWISRWYQNDDLYSPQEISKVFYGMILQGLNSS